MGKENVIYTHTYTNNEILFSHNNEILSFVAKGLRWEDFMLKEMLQLGTGDLLL
jgi:hypothetical protein